MNNLLSFAVGLGLTGSIGYIISINLAIRLLLDRYKDQTDYRILWGWCVPVISLLTVDYIYILSQIGNIYV